MRVLQSEASTSVCQHKHSLTFQEQPLCKGLLKSIPVHLYPGSQLVCMLTQTLVIVTAVHILVAILHVESVQGGGGGGGGSIE